MDNGYEILTVSRQGRTVFAELALAMAVNRGWDPPLSLVLDVEFAKLADENCEALILDIRRVEKVDGSFFPRIVKLWKSLDKRSVSFSLRARGDLRHVLSVLRLDQFIAVDE